MENDQFWSRRRRCPKYHQLLPLIVTVWCVCSCIAGSNAATPFGSMRGSEAGDEKKKMSIVVVEGVVYCESKPQNQLLKDVEVEVECNYRGAKETEVGRTTADGAFNIILQDYDYEALGSNGCKAKLKSSSHTTCTIPTNRGGGLTGTNLVLKERSKDMVILTAGPFAFKQSKGKVTRVETQQNLQSSADDKYPGRSFIPAVSGLWNSPLENNHHTSSQAHYESPDHQENRDDHEFHKDNHRRSEQESSSQRADHKARDKDCSPERRSHHYKTPPHHPVPYDEKSSPPYHSEHHDTPSRHDSSPTNPHHYEAPPYVPYVHHSPLPPHDVYKSPPLPAHDIYEAPPKQYYSPPYYQRSDVHSTAVVASAQPKETSP